MAVGRFSCEFVQPVSPTSFFLFFSTFILLNLPLWLRFLSSSCAWSRAYSSTHSFILSVSPFSSFLHLLRCCLCVVSSSIAGCALLSHLAFSSAIRYAQSDLPQVAPCGTPASPLTRRRTSLNQLSFSPRPTSRLFHCHVHWPRHIVFHSLSASPVNCCDRHIISLSLCLSLYSSLDRRDSHQLQPFTRASDSFRLRAFHLAFKVLLARTYHPTNRRYPGRFRPAQYICICFEPMTPRFDLTSARLVEYEN